MLRYGSAVAVSDAATVPEEKGNDYHSTHMYSLSNTLLASPLFLKSPQFQEEGEHLASGNHIIRDRREDHGSGAVSFGSLPSTRDQ